MRPRITISRAIFAFGAFTVVGLAAVIFASNYALSQLKVGGPLYSTIKLGNDLIADILPPPEYIIEAYLEATLARQDPSTVAARRDRLLQLKKEYDERHEFWIKSELEPVNKARLVEKSHNEVQRFWTLVEQSFLPALAKGDTAQATKSYAEIAAAYTAHRAVVDEIVKKATDDNAAAEAEATSRVEWFTILLWSISACVFLVVGAGIAGVAKGVIRPIIKMTGAMQRLANGELDGEIPSLGRKDEVGAMATALQVFKDNSSRVQAMETAHAKQAKQAEADKKAGMLEMADSFEMAVGRIIRTVSSASAEMEAAAGSLTKTAETTQQLSATVAVVSEQSSSNVRSAAAASEEMAASVAEIGRQVQQSQQIAHAAVAQAEQTNVRIAELSQSASRIGEVIKMITAVAEQTNLLALNATHRGRACRRRRARVRRGGIRGQGAVRANGEGDRRDRGPGHADAVRHRAFGVRDQGDRNHDRADFGDFNRDRRGCRPAGRIDPGNRAQCSAGRPGRDAGNRRDLRRQPRRVKYGCRRGTGSRPRRLDAGGKQPPQHRSRELPADHLLSPGT